MRGVQTRFIAFALALGLGACAGVRWQKADGDETALATDLATCRRESGNRAGISGSFAASVPIDARFGAPVGPSQADMMMQESQAVGRCMRGKGYVLVPDGK